jgi:DNA-binding NarL/FixJ family response regulator
MNDSENAMDALGRAHRGRHDILLDSRSVLAPMSVGPGRMHDAPVLRTVLIVDDHADFRAAARALLEADGYAVIGEAGDGDAAERLTRDLGPSLILLDIGLPGSDGFAVAERLAAMDEPPTVVLISSRERSSYGRRIDAAPVRGFISKRQLSGDALRSVLA